jgi:hypothetical protein
LKKVAILQSNYIPWKGYFDMIAYVDEFILFDDVQYTRRDWRNRNKIKTPRGEQWLSVPVQVKGKYDQKINEAKIDGYKWQQAHWSIIKQNYINAKFFDEIASWLEPLYKNNNYSNLSIMNSNFIEAICSYLSINTVISNSSDYELFEGRTERLINICKQADATEYISGPSAKDYMDDTLFVANNIKLTWFEYSGYSEYPQLWGDFNHGVSILDLLFNCGKDSPKYMRYINK